MSMTRQATFVPFGRITSTRRRVARRDEAVVAAVFRQVEDLPVCEPGQLGGKLVALAQRCRDASLRNRSSVTRAILPSSLPEMIDVGDHPFTGLSCDRRNQGHARPATCR